MTRGSFLSSVKMHSMMQRGHRRHRGAQRRCGADKCVKIAVSPLNGIADKVEVVPWTGGLQALQELLKGLRKRGRGGRRAEKPLNEKFNEHFRALLGLHNASDNQMLKQLQSASGWNGITRSRIFCDHLSQCAINSGRCATGVQQCT